MEAVTVGALGESAPVTVSVPVAGCGLARDDWYMMMN
jgi:hypothetical protein